MNNMQKTLKDNLKTCIIVCMAYFLFIILRISNPSFKELNKLSFGDFLSYIIPVLLSACISFVCYFLIDADLHNLIDKIFLRRRNIGKKYNEIIVAEAEKLQYKIDVLTDEDANFIFYYIANRQPELRGIAFEYWTKIFSFDLYSCVSIVFFLLSVIKIWNTSGFNWVSILSLPYLAFFVICQFCCIPKLYKKAKLLPLRQVRDFSISSEEEFVKLLCKVGFKKNEESN